VLVRTVLVRTVLVRTVLVRGVLLRGRGLRLRPGAGLRVLPLARPGRFRSVPGVPFRRVLRRLRLRLPRGVRPLPRPALLLAGTGRAGRRALRGGADVLRARAVPGPVQVGDRAEEQEDRHPVVQAQAEDWVGEVDAQRTQPRAPRTE